MHDLVLKNTKKPTVVLKSQEIMDKMERLWNKKLEKWDLFFDIRYSIVQIRDSKLENRDSINTQY